MTKRILIADDEPNIVASLEFLMEQAGYEVRTAADGNEALAAIGAFAPDLVLLDVMMPGRSGYEVCERIKCDFPGRWLRRASKIARPWHCESRTRSCRLSPGRSTNRSFSRSARRVAVTTWQGAARSSITRAASSTRSGCAIAGPQNGCSWRVAQSGQDW